MTRFSSACIVRRRSGATALGVVLTLGGCSEAPLPEEAPSLSDDGVSFVVFGDQPYSDADVEAFPGLVAEVNETGAPFVIHVGDIKGGSAACTDSIVVGRREMYRAFEAPMAFTPGDNEWTDCHRAGDDPLERLALLRTAFFGEEGLPLPEGAVVQGGPSGDGSEFVENIRWVHEGIVFATAHVVGSANGLEDYDGRTEADDQEVARRSDAVGRWVEETFGEARRIDASAVVIAAHADVRFDRAARGDTPAEYRHFLEPLEAGARAFEGPVLLLQGDTHSCVFDQPAFDEGSEPLDNFWRLRVAGGEQQTGWFAVTLRPDAATPIEVRPRMLRGICGL